MSNKKNIIGIKDIKFLSSKKLNIDLNLRPQNLDYETYYNLIYEFENL